MHLSGKATPTVLHCIPHQRHRLILTSLESSTSVISSRIGVGVWVPAPRDAAETAIWLQAKQR